MFCFNCGKECSTKVVNEGIGVYEFQGQKGNDKQLSVVSDCCDDDVYVDEYCIQPYTLMDHNEDLECAKADADYDRMREAKYEC